MMINILNSFLSFITFRFLARTGNRTSSEAIEYTPAVPLLIMPGGPTVGVIGASL